MVSMDDWLNHETVQVGLKKLNAALKVHSQVLHLLL
jgi:hypothetical protein